MSMKNDPRLHVDSRYIRRVLLDLLAIPSPSGFTDEVVHYVAGQLEELKVPFEMTRRGTIRAVLDGEAACPARAVVSHLDTIGAMVRGIKASGRLEIAPVGSWSSRFAEGGRVTVFSDHRSYRGTVLPVLASGHAFNEEVDKLPVAWSNVEVRLDELLTDARSVRELGVEIGDFVAFDPQPEFMENGFISARHLDNKAGVAVLLSALRAIRSAGVSLPLDCHPIFTITEEVGSGASSSVGEEVSEFVSIDVGPVAAGQAARETGVTICLQDASGPYDYHLSRKLISLCETHEIPFQRDVFRFYHSDATSAVMAGHDVRTALLAFGTDATHGYERTHMNSLLSLAQLLTVYMQSPPTFAADRSCEIERKEFSHQIDKEDLPSGGTPLPDPKKILG